MNFVGIGLMFRSRIGDIVYYEFGKDFLRIWEHEYWYGLAYHELGRAVEEIWGVPFGGLRM